MAGKSRDALNFLPDIVPVKVYEGDEWNAHFVAKNPDKTPMDIRGMTIEANFRAKGSTVSTELRVIEDDFEQGSFYYGQPEALLNGRYDVKIINTLGLGRSYVRGPVTITPNEA